MATASAEAADSPQPKEATSRSCADAAATAATPSRSSHEELSAGEPPSRATSHANGRDERNRELKHHRAASSPATPTPSTHGERRPNLILANHHVLPADGR